MGQVHRSCGPEGAKDLPCAKSQTGQSVSFPGSLSFEGMKVSWRRAETVCCERPGKVSSECVASAEVEAPGI